MPIEDISGKLFEAENRLSELLIAFLGVVTFTTIIGGFGVFMFQSPTPEMLAPLIKLKYLGNSLYQWIMMLSFTIIARELWMVRRK